MDPIQKMHIEIADVKYLKLEPAEHDELVATIRAIMARDLTLLLYQKDHALRGEDRQGMMQTIAEKAELEERKVQLKASDAHVPQQFLAKFSKLRTEASDLCDFTITCGSKSWPVHKLVLQAQSKVLNRVHRQVGFLEARQSRLDLSEDPEAAVGALIEYIYAMEYASCPTQHEELILHIQVVVLADKNDIPDLVKLATAKFRDTITSCFDPARVAEAFRHTQGDLEDVTRKIRNVMIHHVATYRETFYTGKLGKGSAFAQLTKEDEDLTTVVDWVSMDLAEIEHPTDGKWW